VAVVAVWLDRVEGDDDEISELELGERFWYNLEFCLVFVDFKINVWNQFGEFHALYTIHKFLGGLVGLKFEMFQSKTCRES
jgi:hypothetical protein